VLACFLEHRHADILEATCRALSGVCSETNLHRQVLGLGICGRLIDLMQLPNQKILYWSFVVVQNLCQGGVPVKTFLLKIMQAKEKTSVMRVLLSSTDSQIQKVAYEVVAAFAAGNKSHVQFLIDTMVIPVVLKSIRTNSHVEETALRAIYGVSNVGNRQQINYLKRHNCVPVLDALLRETTEASIRIVTLQTLKNIAKKGGGRQL
jgi:hypothetical protein